MTVASSSSKIIYVDNAATTRLDDDALALMFDLQRNFLQILRRLTNCRVR